MQASGASGVKLGFRVEKQQKLQIEFNSVCKHEICTQAEILQRVCKLASI